MQCETRLHVLKVTSKKAGGGRLFISVDRTHGVFCSSFFYSMSGTGGRGRRKAVCLFFTLFSAICVAFGRSAMVCMATRVYLDRFACFARVRFNCCHRNCPLCFSVLFLDRHGCEEMEMERKANPFLYVRRRAFSLIPLYLVLLFFMSRGIYISAKQDGKEDQLFEVFRFFHFPLFPLSLSLY